jgi:hypothetical protein
MKNMDRSSAAKMHAWLAGADRRFGMVGLRTVGRKVQNVTRQSLLPPDLTARYAQDSFWKNPEVNVCNVPVVLPNPV